jgi:hypothetical protein
MDYKVLNCCWLHITIIKKQFNKTRPIDKGFCTNLVGSDERSARKFLSATRNMLKESHEHGLFKTKLYLFYKMCHFCLLLCSLHIVKQISCDCSVLFCSKDVISEKSAILMRKPWMCLHFHRLSFLTKQWLITSI